MNADEIVNALRRCPETNCLGCPLSNDTECVDTLPAVALELIESMQAQLAEANEQIEWDNELVKKLEAKLVETQRVGISIIPCCICGGEVVEFSVPNDIWNLVMRPDGKETDREYLCWDCWNKALRNKFTQLQRRERAAVGDLCGACESLARATGHGWEDSCAACKWRGPQDGEGERDG